MVAAAWLPAGCSSPPPAASVSVVHEPGETRYSRILGATDQRAVETAFGGLVAGMQPQAEPKRAKRGRWSDVPLAAVFACDDIEAAIVRRVEHDWGWEYRIRTVEDWPGVLEVHRTNDERIYRTTATIGHFADRTDRAEALLKAFDEQMHAFAKKRRLPD